MLEYDLTYNGVTLEGSPSDPEDCFLLQQVEGLDGPDMREVVEPRTARDGDYLGNVLRPGRLVTIAGLITARTGTDFRSRDAALRAAFAPREGLLNLAITNRVGDPPGGLILPCRPAMKLVAPDTADQARYVKAFQVSLRSPDWALLGATLKSTVITSGAPDSGGSTITNSGNARALPLIKLWSTNPGSLPYPNMSIHNVTTGKRLKMTGAVLRASTDPLYLDYENRRAFFYDGVNVDNAYADIDRSVSDWWTLEPGANLIRLYDESEHTSGGRAEVIYRDSYL